MCFNAPAPAPAPAVPAAPAAPVRGSEENRAAVQGELDAIRRRRGSQATTLTGGLGDPGFGGSVVRATALGQ